MFSWLEFTRICIKSTKIQEKSKNGQKCKKTTKEKDI